MMVACHVFWTMMNTMEFVCGMCVGGFIATCLTTIAHIIDSERNRKHEK